MKEILQSPLNYTGGKFKLLPQILRHFPKEIDTFVDLFCGGGNVGCNITCRRVIFNDIDTRVIQLLQLFKENDRQVIVDSIATTINEYGLSWAYKNGYNYYNCDSNNGLGDFNKAPFNKLRESFNRNKTFDFQYFIQFYVLILFAFNNQIRFNAKGEFNLPVGKRDFNVTMQRKLNRFIERLHQINCTFANQDFRNFDINNLTLQDFVYCDPPYLVTCATYNEQGMWTLCAEQDLLHKLDNLNNRGIRFALSNVLSSKGKTNCILKKWIETNPDYTCIHLDYNYSNASYQTKDRISGSDEILVINY